MWKLGKMGQNMGQNMGHGHGHGHGQRLVCRKNEANRTRNVEVGKFLLIPKECVPLINWTVL